MGEMLCGECGGAGEVMRRVGASPDDPTEKLGPCGRCLGSGREPRATQDVGKNSAMALEAAVAAITRGKKK